MTPEARAIEALFNIPNKQGVRVPFKLNQAQRSYDEARTRRDIIAKARQKGFSSLGIGYQTINCLGRQGTRAVLMSHEANATQRLLDKARYYLNTINGPKPDLGRRSRNEFSFPKTESLYYIGTAGGRAFGRGDTITDLHLSEYAWWESDALQHIAGLFQAVPMSGSIRIESTGNGRNNDLYYMVLNAKKLGYSVFFWPWHWDEEYELEPYYSWEPEGFEDYFQDLKTAYNLSEGKLFWYWTKLLEFRGSLRTMKQEYPSVLKECFQATGGAVFDEAEKIDHNQWIWSRKHNYRFNHLANHPIPGHNYVIGADPSGGTGNDDAAATIFDLNTLEQVLEFYDNTIDPVAFGHLLAKLGKEYNYAHIVCESNNHGVATNSVLRKDYRTTLLYRQSRAVNKAGQPRYGFVNTESSKKAMIGAIYECQEMGLILHGKKTTEEMLTFSEDPRTEKLSGPSDNLVIALGLSCVGILKWYKWLGGSLSLEEPEGQKEAVGQNRYMKFTFDEAFGSLDRRKQPGPFPRMIV